MQDVAKTSGPSRYGIGAFLPTPCRMETTRIPKPASNSIWPRLRFRVHQIRGLCRRIAPRLDLLVLAATLLMLALSVGAHNFAVAAVSLVLAGLVLARQFVSVREVLEIDMARRKSEARFGWLVMNSSDLIISVDSARRIDYVSPSVERVLRAGELQLLGARLTDIAHPEDCAAVDGLLDRAMRSPGERTSVEWRLRQADGS